MPQVEVTDADREAAAKMLREIGSPFYADEAAEGQADESSAVQAFARHRIAALEDALRALHERLPYPTEACAIVRTLKGSPR